jgi:hypothetical protein
MILLQKAERGRKNKRTNRSANVGFPFHENKIQVIPDLFGGAGGFPLDNLDNLCDRTVDLRPLKQFLLERIAEDFPLKSILLAEPDEMPINLYMARLPVYLKLCESKKR